MADLRDSVKMGLTTLLNSQQAAVAAGAFKNATYKKAWSVHVAKGTKLNEHHNEVAKDLASLQDTYVQQLGSQQSAERKDYESAIASYDADRAARTADDEVGGGSGDFKPGTMHAAAALETAMSKGSKRRENQQVFKAAIKRVLNNSKVQKKLKQKNPMAKFINETRTQAKAAQYRLSEAGPQAGSDDRLVAALRESATINGDNAAAIDYSIVFRAAKKLNKVQLNDLNLVLKEDVDDVEPLTNALLRVYGFNIQGGGRRRRHYKKHRITRRKRRRGNKTRRNKSYKKRKTRRRHKRRTRRTRRRRTHRTHRRTRRRH